MKNQNPIDKLFDAIGCVGTIVIVGIVLLLLFFLVAPILYWLGIW